MYSISYWQIVSRNSTLSQSVFDILGKIHAIMSIIYVVVTNNWEPISKWEASTTALIDKIRPQIISQYWVWFLDDNKSFFTSKLGLKAHLSLYVLLKFNLVFLKFNYIRIPKNLNVHTRRKYFFLTKKETIFPIANSLSYQKEEKLQGFHWIGCHSMQMRERHRKKWFGIVLRYEVSESLGVVCNFKTVLPTWMSRRMLERLKYTCKEFLTVLLLCHLYSWLRN